MAIDITGSGSDNGTGNGLFVPGDGPDDARLMLCGEAPARNEIRIGRPFVGQAGQYLAHVCRMTGLPPREMMYITNLIKVPAIDNETEWRMEEQINEWEWMLKAELEERRPEVVATLGSWSTRWFLRNYSPGYPHTNDLDWLHGLPRIGTAQWGTFLMVPCFHPAAGLHDSDAIPKIYADLHALRKVLSGQSRPRHDSITNRQYKWLEQPIGIEAFGPHLAIDTEGWPNKVNMISFSDTPGYGRVIRDHNLMRWFATILPTYTGTLIMHNMPWDLKVLTSIGLDTTRLQCKLVDTMQLAKYLNTEPGGLKALSWRHLGVEMNEYMDIVRPIQRQFAIKYIEMLSCIDYPKPEPELQWQNGQPKVHTPWSLTRRLKKITTDMAKNPNLDVLDRWTNIPDRVRDMGVEVFGPMPEANIDHVDPDLALHYSGQDADTTLCLYFALLDKLKEVYGTS